MKTREDVWNFICENGYSRTYIHYYVKPFPDDYHTFWDTLISALEMCGMIDKETAWNIWRKVREAEEA